MTVSEPFNRLREIPHEGTTPKNPVLTASCSLLESPIDFASTLHLEVEIKVVATNFNLPVNSTITLTCDPCHVSDLRFVSELMNTNQTLKLQFELKPRANMTLANLGEKVLIRGTTPQGTSVEFDIKGFALSMSFFSKELSHWRPPNNQMCNILMFGYAGAGKSTLLNKLYSIASHTYIETQQTRNTPEHVTRTLKKQPLDYTPWITLVDTPGLSYHNSTVFSDLFKYILEGVVDEHQDLAIPSGAKRAVPIMTNASKMHPISGCILVVPSGAIYDDDNHISFLRKHIDMAHDAGIPVILAVTHRDEMTPADYEESRKKLSKSTTINLQDIHLLDNGESETAEKDTKSFYEAKDLYLLMKNLMKKTGESIERNQGFITRDIFTCSIGVDNSQEKPKMQLFLEEQVSCRTIGPVLFDGADPYLTKMTLSQLRTEIRDQLDFEDFVFLTEAAGKLTAVTIKQEQNLAVSSLRPRGSEAPFNGASLKIQKFEKGKEVPRQMSVVRSRNTTAGNTVIRNAISYTTKQRL